MLKLNSPAPQWKIITRHVYINNSVIQRECSTLPIYDVFELLWRLPRPMFNVDRGRSLFLALVTMHFAATVNDLCDHSHYISAHVGGVRKTGAEKEKNDRGQQRGWVVLPRESRIVCREIVVRWRIPDCECALLVNGQKNRCKVAHTFGSVERMSAHFLTVRFVLVSYDRSFCFHYSLCLLYVLAKWHKAVCVAEETNMCSSKENFMNSL